MFIGFTPLFGFQFLLAGVLAWVLGGSIIASALGTFVANPLSVPVIWYSTYKLGCVMLTGNVLGACGSLPEGLASWGAAVFESLMDFSMETALVVFHGIWPVIKPMALGSLPIGALAAAISYIAIRQTVELRQRRRRERLRALRPGQATSSLRLPGDPSAQGA